MNASKETPLYLSVPAAARYAGLPGKLMDEWVHDRIDPIPHIVKDSGRMYVQTAAIAPYADKRCLKGVTSL